MLKKSVRVKIIIVVVFVFACGLSASAYTPVSYPGGTWGGVSDELSGLEGVGSQGWIKQGIRWFSWKESDLESYLSYDWRMRKKNPDYYNTHGIGLDLSLKRKYTTLGVDLALAKYPNLGVTEDYFNLFLGWYRAWKPDYLNGKSIAGFSPLAFPLSSWGRITHDLQNVEGTGSQGWIKQGIDWVSFGQGWIFNTYASLNWRFRSENREYYNAWGPSLGINFSKNPFDIGVEYVWQTLPELDRSQKTLNLYIAWFYEWDLKRK